MKFKMERKPRLIEIWSKSSAFAFLFARDWGAWRKWKQFLNLFSSSYFYWRWRRIRFVWCLMKPNRNENHPWKHNEKWCVHIMPAVVDLCNIWNSRTFQIFWSFAQEPFQQWIRTRSKEWLIIRPMCAWFKYNERFRCRLIANLKLLRIDCENNRQFLFSPAVFSWS